MKRYCNLCNKKVDFVEYLNTLNTVLQNNSHAVLRGNSHAELQNNSHAVLWDNSHAVLWDNSHAELWGNSHAELQNNSHAVLRDNSHAQCNSPYACAILKSTTSQCRGRHIGDKSLTPKEYLKNCGIEIKNQFVILYKSVKSDFCSYKIDDIKYIIGKETIAPDWDKNVTIECGKGLHLSPTIQQARLFNDGGLYLACRVKLSDIANLPAYSEYPDKIRVRACMPLYQVDKDGNKL